MATIANLVVKMGLDAAQFDTGFARASRTVGVFGDNTMRMSRGLHTIERGLFALGLQSVGLTGPLGQVAKGILALGVGGPLVGGAILGAGLMSAAYMKLTEDTRKLREEEKKREESLRRQIASTKQLTTMLGLIMGQGDPRFGTLQLMGMTPKTGPAGPPRVLGRLNAQQAAQDAAQQMIERIQLATALGETSSERAKRQLAFAGAGGGVGGSLAGDRGMRSSFDPRFRPPTTFTGQDQARFTGIRLLTAGTNQQQAADLAASATERKVNTMHTLSSAILMLGAVAGQSGNRVGQMLMGAGGIVGSIPGGQLAGAGIGIAGAIINLFGGGSKPLLVHDDQLARQLKNQRHGPDSTSVNIISASTGEVIEQFYVDARSRTRRDRQTRVPIYLPT